MSKKCWETIVLCAALAGTVACGVAEDPRTRFQPDGGGSGSAGGDPWASLHDSGFGPIDVPAWPDGGGTLPNEPEDEKPGECGASSFEAEKITVQKEVQVESQVTTVKPVVLYIMFDHSQSMKTSNLWDPGVSAMKSFINDGKSQGIGVGIQYFPLNGGSCSTGAGYKTPKVDVGLLPAQAAKLSQSLDDANPDGFGTPIEGALRGVTEFCKTYQASHPAEQCVSVLVTDGKPEYASGCSEDPNTLAGIAGAAKTAGVTTFAVGLSGADFSLLDKIAKQGGAPDCDTSSSAWACNVSGGAGKLADALTKIRDTVVTTETHTVIETQVEETTLPCEWGIPAQPDGRAFDPDKVNIRWTTASAETTFLRVSSSAKCQANAWHFDDAEAPKRLVACPQTCDAIKSEPNAKLDILLGCASLVPQ